MTDYRNIRKTKRYCLAKERIRRLLKNDKVLEVSNTSGIGEAGSRITLHLGNGKQATYRGRMTIPLMKFIWKKRYCKDEMPEVKSDYIGLF